MASSQNLIDALFENAWPTVHHLLEVKPKLAKQRTITRSFENDGQTSQILPIHMACRIPNLPLEVLKALVSVYPESPYKTETGYHRNCLQIAIRAGGSNEVIRFLLQNAPSSASHQDSWGRVALHYACGGNGDGATSPPPPLSLLLDLIEACPAAICATDKKKKYTPLHLAILAGLPLESVQALIAVEPKSVLMLSWKGETPLDMALSVGERSYSKSTSLQDIVELLIQEVEKYQQLPMFQNFEKASQNKSKLRAVQQTSCFV